MKPIRNFTCEVCGKVVDRPPSQTGRGKTYCSITCLGKDRRDQVIATCSNCGILFSKIPSSFRGQLNLFCSKSCETTFRRKKTLLAPLEFKKRAARRAVRDAIAKGLLKRGRCSICGEFRAEAHHKDYDKPLEVSWYCYYCHKSFAP